MQTMLYKNSRREGHSNNTAHARNNSWIDRRTGRLDQVVQPEQWDWHEGWTRMRKERSK